MAAASAPTETTKPKAYATCGGLKRRGGTCTRPAGWGTEHPGTGTCKLHGGCSPAANKAAARATARRLGEERDLEPLDGIMLTIRGDAGWAEFCRLMVAELDPDSIVIRHEKVKLEYAPRISYDVENDAVDDGGTVIDRTVETSTSAELNLWIREWRVARDDLARHCKIALDAGVQERHVALAEQLAGDIAHAIDGILTAHGITGAKRKPNVIRTHLQLLQGGIAA